MARKAIKKRRGDRARVSFLLLMLSVMLVLGFGLILGKQEQINLQQTAAVPTSSAGEVPEETTEETVPTEEITETVPEYHQATDFWFAENHIYLRVNHRKKINIGTKPDFNIDTAFYQVSDENIAVVDEEGMITGVSKGECTVTMYCGEETLEIPVTVREMTVENGCTYVDGILIANKNISLPEDYDPGMLPETAEAFEELRTAAKEEGLNIYQGSGYRSYQYQIKTYNSLVRTYGHEYADRISAKPGHSEHQTGYTVDCNTINQDFINTAEGQWLDAHCHEFGFIIRYPQGKEDITGYAYECWHIRYVGKEIAADIYAQGLTLEEYLDLVDIENEISPTETETESETESAGDTVLTIAETDVPEETETIPYQETVPPVTEAPQYQETVDAEIIDAPLEAP